MTRSTASILPGGEASRTLILVAAVSGAVMVAGCTEWKPERPDVVPPAAVYAGGEDGGMWADCSGAVGKITCLIWDIDGGNPRRSVFAACPAVPPGLTPQFLDDTRMEGRSRFFRIQPDEDLSPGGERQALYDESFRRWGNVSVCRNPVS